MGITYGLGAELDVGHLDSDEIPDFLLGTESGELWVASTQHMAEEDGDLVEDGVASVVDFAWLVKATDDGGPVVPRFVGSMGGDGLETIALGVPHHDTSDTERAGLVYVIEGPLSGDVDLDSDTAITGEHAYAGLGSDIAGLGDINGDGLDDLAASMPNTNVDDLGKGTVLLFLGGRSTGGTASELKVAEVLPSLSDEELGWSIEGPGDLDGDGIVDMIVSSPKNYEAGDTAGGAWVIYGPLSGTLELDHSNDDMTFIQGEEGSATGFHMAAEDQDGDGAIDLLLGAPDKGDSMSGEGQALLFRGLAQ